MKKAGAIIAAAIFFILLAELACAEVRINEAELNPQGNDSGFEWIELYSDSLINLTGYNLTNADNNVLELNFSFNGYYIYNFASSWLDNDQSEKVNLTNVSGALIYETPPMNDSSSPGDNRTWQYCGGSWSFRQHTPTAANNCTDPETPPENETEDDEDNEISIEISWDEEEIVNGEEFDIDVDFENLESKDYDVKVFIYDDDQNSPISEIYNTIEEEWQSSYSYIEEIVSGSGDKSETFSLRIKSSESSFYGDAKIKVRIRDSSGTITDSDSEDIEILEAEEDSDSGEDGETAGNENVSAQSASGAIRLGKSAETSLQNNSKKGVDGESRGSIIYKSKNEYIREYAVYGFGILCIAIIILLLIDRK